MTHIQIPCIRREAKVSFYFYPQLDPKITILTIQPILIPVSSVIKSHIPTYRLHYSHILRRIPTLMVILMQGAFRPEYPAIIPLYHSFLTIYNTRTSVFHAQLCNMTQARTYGPHNQDSQSGSRRASPNAFSSYYHFCAIFFTFILSILAIFLKNVNFIPLLFQQISTTNFRFTGPRSSTRVQPGRIIELIVVLWTAYSLGFF